MIYTIDYETYYSKDYSIKTLGNWAYTHHEQFDPFLLAVSGTNDFEWVGSPRDFEWKRLEGAEIVATNAGFELAVTERLGDLGVAPRGLIRSELLHDTADLAAYLGVPRSLAGSAEHLLGITLDKSTRDKAKGKRWKDMTPAFQAEMKSYALRDSKTALRIWTEYSHKWPEWEQQLSVLTRDMCWRGLPVDIAAVEAHISTLQHDLWKVRTQIPWVEGDPDAPALSLKKAAEECRKHGIEPPSSMAKDSPEFAIWLETNEAKFPWAKALGQYRSMNRMLQTLITLKTRTEEETKIFRYGLKYGGAHTMRDSGDAGFNVQNPPREPMHGVDLRAVMCTAPDGYTLGVADLSAIEPCVLSILSGDEELADKLRTGMDVYEAQARVTGKYDDPRPLKEVDKELRKYMKIQVLGMSYGAGPDKVQIIAKNQAGLELDHLQAQQLVHQFRKRKFIPKLWQKLETDMNRSSPGDYEMELPSGRIMRYRKVQRTHGLSAVIPRQGKMMRLKWWGGSLTENLVQSTARDVFMWQMLQLNKAGIQVLLRAHDEAVALFKEDEAEEMMNYMLQIMAHAPPWMPNLPVFAEGILSKTYRKP
jgi:DNA polymerase bacteriophage-type